MPFNLASWWPCGLRFTDVTKSAKETAVQWVEWSAVGSNRLGVPT